MEILSNSLKTRILDIQARYTRAGNFLQQSKAEIEGLIKKIAGIKIEIEEQETKHTEAVYKLLKNGGDESQVKNSMAKCIDNKLKLVEAETALKHAKTVLESDSTSSKEILRTLKDEFKSITDEAWKKLFMEELAKFDEAFQRLFRLFLRTDTLSPPGTMHHPSVTGFITTYQLYFMDKRFHTELGTEMEKKEADKVFIKKIGIDPTL